MRSRNGAITSMNCARPCMYSMYTVFCKRPLSPATLLVVTPAISESESQYSSSGEWVSEWVKMPSNRSYSLCKCRSCCGLQQWYMRAGPRRTQYVRPYRRSVSPSPPNCTSFENDFQCLLWRPLLYPIHFPHGSRLWLISIFFPILPPGNQTGCPLPWSIMTFKQLGDFFQARFGKICLVDLQ